MKKARTRTKLCLVTASILFALFLLGESPIGQRSLIGKLPPDHFEADDRYMGAGLAPFAYCLLPAIVVTVVGIASYVVDHRRS